MRVRNRILSLLLAVLIMLSMLPLSASALDNLSLPKETAKSILNGVELHPQKTGYSEVDALMESILRPYEERDTYTKVRSAYVWLIRNIRYSWMPYSQHYAPAYDCFDVVHDLSYEEGLQESAPFEIVNRAYHAMEFKRGVCYDYAAAFALLLRYIGIDAFVHTGTFLLEDSKRSPCHHGWTEVLIDGSYYIFDPQREYRLAGNGSGMIFYEYFMIPLEDGWRYSDPEIEINAERDAQFLPVAAPRSYGCKIEVKSTPSGNPLGSGFYQTGSKFMAEVEPIGEREFVGWFDKAGQLLAESGTYPFTVTKNMTLIAVFKDEYYIDASNKTWYYKAIDEEGEHWVINGIRPFEFGANETITRSMAVAILGRALKAAMPDFKGAPENAWISSPLCLPDEQRLSAGILKNGFAPEEYVTREQFIAMLMRVADYLDKTPEKSELTYRDADQISPYALEAMQEAQTVGLLDGDSDNTIRPQERLTKAEGTAMIKQLLRWLGM